jgi:hypothetical protein
LVRSVRLVHSRRCAPFFWGWQLYLSVDSSDARNGIAGALGFYGQVAAASVTSNGQSWSALNFVYASLCAHWMGAAMHALTQAGLHSPLFSSAQSCASTADGTGYLVGFWLERLNSTYGDVCAFSLARPRTPFCGLIGVGVGRGRRA